MQIEHFALRLRRRSVWEALDLGHALLRAWAGPAYRVWGLAYGTTAALLLTLFWTQQVIALALLWWLKPAFDRVLLFSYSRSLFGQTTSWRDLRAALPDLLRRSGLLLGLTVHRFSLLRSFVLPVRQLEGQRGRAARERRRVLARKSGAGAVWLMFVCVNLEIALYCSLVIVVGALLPQGSEDVLSLSLWFLGDVPPEQEIVTSLLALAVSALVEPLYVASGFALYLNRRSELEGWDIELAFRRLARRPPPAPAVGSPVGFFAALLLTLACTAAITPAPVWAQEPSREEARSAPRSEPPTRARRTIDAVLADPEFGHKSESTQWRWRESPVGEESRPPAWLDFVLRVVEFVSQVLKGLVWIAWIAGAAVLAYFLLRYRETLRSRRAPRPEAPEFLYGLDLRPQSLPDDVPAAARASLAAGRVAEALSLLYRGALIALIRRDGIDFRPGDTEADCRRRVAGQVSAEASGFFAALLDAWQEAAYAGAAPGGARVEALCAAWPRHFAVAAGGQS
ncbi:MAG: DUF4129 domain-containing protein [Azonexus sp.]|nr:DUF4129 domain-containing protein [Betaproteobacteria bacterium]MBP6036357.1 DUF4129 domain-containing protein [Azonexus sp.]MBP6906779.1 DUF4129 domain-containing protein [Azonexus sp.]